MNRKSKWFSHRWIVSLLALAVIASVVGLLLRWVVSPELSGSVSGTGAKGGASGGRNVVALAADARAGASAANEPRVGGASGSGAPNPGGSAPPAAVAVAGRRAAGEVAADRYEAAEVLESREAPSRGGERIRRVRLVRTDFKYPLLRLDEEIDEVEGKKRVVRQMAMVADHVLVKAPQGKSEEELLAALKPLGAQIRGKMRASGIWLVSFPNPTVDTVPDAVAEITRLGLVRYAEPDFVVRADYLPNDASFSSLWGLHNTGQSGGTVDADIDAPEAWDLTTGNRSVLVGVIDTGIDHSHPDLAANMWTNPNETAGNGIDDDGNGYIDDTRGWDFVNNDNNPMDDNRHGTHCAGTIGGTGNNGAGVAGVSWQVSLVGLKFLSGSGSGATSDAVEATAYATGIGVALTSNSWGGGGFSQALKDAIDSADAAGILYVAAAGNSSANSDLTTNYPSGYTSTNIIAVASTTRSDALSSFSNYGATTVDLGAPGSDIYSTTPGNTYSTLSGTSMATPHVAGACALLKAYRPTLGHSELKSLIMQSADAISALAGKCVSGGRLNVYNAMLYSSDITMAPGSGLAASGEMGGPVTPSSITYTLTNRASSAAAWTAAADQPWVMLSSAGGTLAAGATANLTVSLTPAVSSLDGGAHNATVTITNTTSGRNQTRSVSLDVLPPVIISDNLNANPGWPVTGQWAFGRPTGGGAVAHGNRDPSAGATGANVFGVNLNGDYSVSPGGPWFVTAGPFDLSLHQTSQLEFMRWLNTDMPYYVTATIEASNDGSTWTSIWANADEVADNAWKSQRYDISAVADQRAQVWIRWGYKVNNVTDVWAYSGWNIDDIKIRGVPVRNLAFAPPAGVSEGDAPVTVSLTVTPVPSANQTVTLASSDPAQATVPASITIPAGQATATFQISPVDDVLADGTHTVTITAGSSGFQDRSGTIDIHDNETRTLTLALPSTVAEGSGAIAGQAAVGLNAAADTDVRVSLASSDITELQVPASVVIPTGQTTAPVTLSAPEDSLIDGSQTAVITAIVQNWTSASGAVNVADNEALALSLTLPAALLEGQGGSAPVGSVVLTGIATAAVEVSISSDDATELTVPAGVTIQPGQSSGTFPVTVLNDGIVDGSQTVTLTAAASDFSDGTGQIIIHDAETPAIPSSPQPVAGAAEAHPDSDLAWSYATGTGGVPDHYDVYFGTSSFPGTTELVASAVTTPVHSLARLNPGTTYYWKIVAHKGVATTSGPVWSFSVPPVGNPTRFAWSTISSPKQVDDPIPVTITGYDAYDNVATFFNGEAAIKPVQSDSTIVIAEVNPNTPDEIEFVNVSPYAVDISGWVVSIYDVDLWPNRKAFTIPAGTICPAGSIFRLREDGAAPGSYPQFNFGSNINWTSSSLSAVAVLLSKADGTMVDFMCAASANPSSITVPSAIPPAQWSGSTIPAPVVSTNDYARQGNSDASNASNWTTAAPGLGALNPGLTIPFAGTPGSVPVVPGTVTFTAGVWTGDLRARAPALGLRLRAEDAGAHRGDSNDFDVTSIGPLSLSVAASTYEESAGVVAGALTVTLPAAAASAVTISIASSDPSEIASSTITVPTGQLSASGPLTVLNDTDLDGTQAVELDASVVGYVPASVNLGIHDDETTVLALSIPASASESAGLLAGQGTVSLPEAVGADVRVSLASNDTSEIVVPATVIIPSGSTSASFDITVVQDALLDGAQSAIITASVVGWTSGSATMQVPDDETAAITLAMDAEAHEGMGTDPSVGVVTLGGVAVSDVEVALASSDASEIIVPATVTIPAGQSSIAIPGTIVDDAELDGTQTSVISAVAFANPAVTSAVAVRDNDAASFELSTVASPQKEGVLFPLSVTAKDVNGLVLPLVSGFVTLAASGDGGPVGVSVANLSPFVNGTWTGTLFIASPGTNVRLAVAGSQASAQGNAFEVLMGPRISVSPASYTLSIPRQSSKTRTLTISNNGAEPLYWSALGNAWLSATPSSGTVPPGTSMIARVNFNAASLTEGILTAALNINSNDALNTPLGIPVSLTVSAPVASFTWDAVPSPQRVNAPFPVTVSAKDAGGATVADFEGTANLATFDSLGSSEASSTTGTESFQAGGPIWTSVPSLREQFIYLPSQIGAAGRITKLALSVSQVPAIPLTRFTIRLKHTTKTNFSADPTWEAAGWTTVYQSNQTVTLGWLEFPLSVPFDYDGTSNLMVDFSFMNTGTGSMGLCSLTYTADGRGLYHDTSTTGSDPLTWTGAVNSPYAYTSQAVLRVTRQTFGGPGQIAPTVTSAFSAGVWSGDVAIPSSSPDVKLVAALAAPATATGQSNSFVVAVDGALGITLASQVSEGEGTLGGTVTITPAPAADVAVTLNSSVASAATPVVASVTVPAGSTSAPFTLNIIDDTALDGPQTTQIGAVGAGYAAVSAPLVVADDEGAALSINLAQNSYAEGAGVISGTITSDTAPTVPVTIALASSDTTEATVPASVTLAAGATSVAFSATIANDTLVDGDQSVVLTAAVAGWASGTKNLTVTDNEARTLTLTGVPPSISEGAATPATPSVALTGQAVVPVVVTLASSDTTALPSLTVTIPAGASSAVFSLDPVDDTLFDGTQNVTLTASAATFSDGMANVAVVDDDVHHFEFSAVPSPQIEGAGFAFTATAKDINDVTIAAPVGGPVNLTAAGDGGVLTVLPAVLTPFVSGAWTGQVRVMAPDTNVRLTVASPTASNQSNAFDVGMGPRAGVNPASYAVSVAQNTTKTRTLTVSNTGAEPLNWSALTAGDVEPPLAAALAGLNARHAEITALIPNRHDFTEGVTGTSISSGGTHMYHSGNYLSTTLASTNYVPYSDNTIVTDATRFGTGGRYFTRKVPGLFVLAADMSGVSGFAIGGSTGNHSGLVGGSVLTATRGAKTYKGFVKRAHGDAGAQSIHHLIIVESDAAASHAYSATADSDNHVLSGIGGRSRLYYLLYSGLSGGNVDDIATQTIFDKFLDVIGAASWMTVTPSSGTVAAGGSQNVSVAFNASSFNTGLYSGSISITSNDALTSPLTIPAAMTVTPGIHHFEWETLPSPQVVNAPVAATIRARDAANALVTDFDGTAALTALNTASAGEASTGSGSSSTWFVHDTSYPVHRTQSIYTPAEAGPAARLSGLAFDVATLGSPAASNFTIRLKHTGRVNYATDTSWEGGGWTTVFAGSQTLVAGLNYFTFSTPFDYSGTSNLMVDISFVNTTYSSASYVRYTTASPARTIYSGAYSSDPLQWSGSTGYASTALPNLRLVKSGSPAAVFPVTTGAFAAGVWSGEIRLGTVGDIAVTASAGGAAGTSNLIATTAVGTFTLSVPASLTEGQGVIAAAGTIAAASPPVADLTVFLESSDPSEFTLPAQITLPAGQSSVSFDVTVVDDALLDGPVTAQARALAVGYPTVASAVTVADNDATTVTLNLPASISEGTSSVAGQATVQIGGIASENLAVTLSSSLASRLTVPASVVIPAGQSSVPFILTAPNNGVVDGDVPVTLSATLEGSAPASGVVQVVDNESRAITITSFYSSMSENSAPLESAAYVSLSGTAPAALTITLASSDTTELTVPATITISAGSTSSSYFALTPVNDSLQDGAQTVTITASAPTFTSGNRSITILDDDVHHFAVSTVSGAKIRNVPFNVTFTAKDLNGVTINSYNGSPVLSAMDGGAVLAVSPSGVTGFSSGVKTQAVTMQDFASAAVLTLTDGATGAAGSSNAFVVTHGSHSRFGWSTIASPKTATTPFASTITAQDSFGNPVSGFTGTAVLSALSLVTVGSGTSSSAYPLNAYYDDVRSQMIFTAAEMGAARDISFIALDVVSLPSVALSNFTVRMKQTSRADYASDATWDGDGWTICLQGSQTIGATGWNTLAFTTPFSYDGSRNVMVDISFNNASPSYSSGGAVRATTGSSSRMISSGQLNYSNPLTWSGSSPAPSIASTRPNIRFGAPGVPVSPTVTGSFAAGVWSGDIALAYPASNIVLQAASGAISGNSNSFNVASIGSLTLGLAASIVEESGGTVSATLSVSAAQGADLVVALASSKPSAATVPPSVNIPAGQTSVTFPVTVTNDTVLEGSQVTTLTASVPGFDHGTADLTVLDDETTTVTLVLPGSVAEGTSTPAGQASVHIAATSPVALSLALSSSAPGRVGVPAIVTIPAGQSSASFTLSAPNNSTIEPVPVQATIAATLAGSPPATGSVQVADDESHSITLSLFYASVSEGAPPYPSGGYVYLPAPVSSPLTVNLSSSDASELLLPATAVIAAGANSSPYFTLTPVNDSVFDGSQQVTAVASAPSFTPGSYLVTVLDDDLHHLSISGVPSPQVRNAPFAVAITAKDVNDAVIYSFDGAISLSANDGITPLTITPASIAALTNGSATISVVITDSASSARITATDPVTGVAVTSNAFTVGAGVLAAFAWDSVASVKEVDMAFPVTLRAMDAYGNVVTNFNSSVTLGAEAVAERQVGTGALASSYPFYNSSYSSRSQFIYLASEVGVAGSLRALALNVASAPSVAMSNFTIRLRHTPKADYVGGGAWETAGWTTVYQGNLSVSGPGWHEFAFTTPFAYNGTDNLMVDFSYGNGLVSYAIGGTVQGCSSPSRGFVSSSNYSNPIEWGFWGPMGNISSTVPNVRFITRKALTMTPATTGAGFVGGVWNGSVSIGQTADAVGLSAISGSGASGWSNFFAVVKARPPLASWFEISGLPEAVASGQPVPVTLTARDANGALFTGYAGIANLAAQAPGLGPVVSGMGAATAGYPSNGAWVEGRSQIIYPATELGGRARRIVGMAINVASASSTVLQSFKVRVKHTTHSFYFGAGASPAWDANFWANVYSGTLSSPAAGWLVIPFTTAFDYDGTSGLMVDMSYDNAASFAPVSLRADVADASVMIQGGSTVNDSLGAPTGWAGATPALGGFSVRYQAKFLVEGGLAVSPERTGAFTNGSWSGLVNFSGLGRDVVLRAWDSSGRVGLSSQFSAGTSAPSMSALPAFTGGTAAVLQWSPVGTASAYQLQSSLLTDFSALAWDAVAASSPVAVGGLSDGGNYKHRVRSTNPVTQSPDAWSQRQWGEWAGDSHHHTSAETLVGAVALARLDASDSTVSDEFDSADAGWISQFTALGGNPGYLFDRASLSAGPNTTPPLPINQGGDLEARVTGTFAYALTADAPASAFADGAIEGYIAPETLGSSASGGLVLRAGIGPTGNVFGYRAGVFFTTSSTAVISLSTLPAGLALGTTANLAVAVNDIVRLRFEALGPRLVLRAWKVSESGGAVVETPVLFAGSDTLVVHDSRYGLGRAGLYFSPPAGSAMLVDDVSVTRSQHTYLPSGHVTSPVIAPGIRSQWGSLNYTSDTSMPGTSLAVDVLDASGNVLASGVASGTDLSTLAPVMAKPAIRLRARLASANASNSPLLRQWAVAFATGSYLDTHGPWSNIVSSIQDASSPVLAAPALSTSASFATLTGTAVDATSGVASVAVSGSLAATSDGFSTWNAPVSGLLNGANAVSVSASDNAVPPNLATVTVLVYRLITPAADSDGDGISDLLEHAFTIPMLEANPRAMLPIVTVQTDGGSGQKFLTLDYRRRIQRAGLAYAVETSTDMAAWTSAAGDIEEQSVAPVGDGLTETVRVRVSPALGGMDAKFVRLKVTVQ